MAEVEDVLRLCRYKNKYLAIRLDGKIEEISIYGSECRLDEFQPGKQIYVRKSDRLGIVTIPGNLQTTRVVVFPSLFLIAFVGLIFMIREEKKKKQLASSPT